MHILSHLNKNRKNKSNKGFTLIEIMVAASLFLVVMLMVSGAIYTVLDANRKSSNLRSAMDNLNLALEGMTRTVRFGKNYHCGSGGNIYGTQDCLNGEDTFSLQQINGLSLAYSLSNGRIVRNNSGTLSYVTSADITITQLSFFVSGSEYYIAGDHSQPFVIIVVSGFVGTKPTTKSTFTLQTSVSQRLIDFL